MLVSYYITKLSVMTWTWSMLKEVQYNRTDSGIETSILKGIHLSI